MIRNEDRVIANSLWTATANDTPHCPPLNGDAETDIAVIGGGYTGLSAALHLAEQGIRVTVLEAETPGWGASGRNGGQVNPGLKDDPDGIEEKFGQAKGGQMVDLSGGAGQFVFDLIKRLGIACDARQTGWIQPFHSTDAEAVIKTRVAQWQNRGADISLLSREETAALLGTTAYLGSMIDRRGGNLHPLNYALGLASAALDAGAVIHGTSRVVSFNSEGDRHVLRTNGGQLTARKVLICTNAYSHAGLSDIARTVVPVRSVQVATGALPESIQQAILPQGHSASDSRRLLLYFRKDHSGRFIMGGRGAYSARGTRRQMQSLREMSETLYPALRGIEWEFAWGGYVAITADHYPHLNQLAPDVMAALGYNGRGVAMASVMGKVLADWASGMTPEELPFPVTAARPIPFHFLRKPAVTAAVVWARLRDRN